MWQVGGKGRVRLVRSPTLFSLFDDRTDEVESQPWTPVMRATGPLHFFLFCVLKFRLIAGMKAGTCQHTETTAG